MIRRVSSALVILVFAFSFFACEEQGEIAPSIITEEALLVSGERMRLSGRIITTQNISATNHGFYISDNEGFSQPIIISLGERETPGRFIGETSGLTIEKNYFVKSFVDLPSETIFGNVVELQTLSPNVSEYSPNRGQPGMVVTINGVNITEDVKVFFGNVEAEVVSVDFETILRVRVPAIGDESTVPVRVVIQSKEIVFQEPFVYRTGVYTKISQFPGNIRFTEGVSLQESTTFYAGLGIVQPGTLNSTFWKWTYGETEWTQVDSPSPPLRRAFSTKTFFGGGSDVPAAIPNNERFYKLENGEFIQLPDLDLLFINGVGFEIDEKLYLAGGDTGEGTATFLVDTNTGDWEFVSHSPFKILSTDFSFTYQSKQYFIDPETRNLYYYDPNFNNWEIVGSYPGELGNNGGGFAAVIGDKVFVGVGNRSNQMWELNMQTLEWDRKNDFTGSSLARVIGTYQIDDEIFILRSPETQVGGSIEFWKIEPNAF
ncbi:IPT/TIG domain-containing protein [Mongoliibacter ruber]|uniref:IPT/TIG domain-containing protein n=1 Tax=Mongoliibacter ruber TaxID=1750599 RepID=A0A2T0WIU0_9BACT|nr:IPT/TIG domain-containing protein [Mongoliibacter ruber]PRY86606.1 IPT/TIG domain-containing protein [Mongoliibacter ruber]